MTKNDFGKNHAKTAANMRKIGIKAHQPTWARLAALFIRQIPKYFQHNFSKNSLDMKPLRNMPLHHPVNPCNISSGVRQQKIWTQSG